jgi:hypothetical protein
VAEEVVAVVVRETEVTEVVTAIAPFPLQPHPLHRFLNSPPRLYLIVRLNLGLTSFLNPHLRVRFKRPHSAPKPSNRKQTNLLPKKRQIKQ